MLFLRFRNGVDPQKGTIADALTRSDLERMIYHMAHDGGEASLKYCSMICLAQQMMQRGDDQRGVALCDLFTYDIPLTAIRPSPCTALCIVSYCGKKNSDGRTEYGFSFRNKYPLFCGHGALARYLFFRLSVKNEKLPDLTKNMSCCNILQVFFFYFLHFLLLLGLTYYCGQNMEV